MHRLKMPRLPLRILYGCGLFVSMLGPSAVAQNQSPSVQQSDATALLAQLGNAFSAGKTVSQIQLSGSATWYAGGGEDSGTATPMSTPRIPAPLQMNQVAEGWNLLRLH